MPTTERIKTNISEKIKIRNKLSGDGLFDVVADFFTTKVKDHRAGNSTYSLSDVLMSGLAVFSLKQSSLLQFDEKRKNDEAFILNLKNVFNISNVPADTTLRETLDQVGSQDIRGAFKRIFFELQRGKVLERFAWKINNSYLLSLDGTSYFSSEDIHCDNCQEKKHSNGKVTYSHSMLSGVIIHPHKKEVMPLCPEPIIKQDGKIKNDCEINAAKRFINDFTREYFKLKVTLLGDDLFSNGPFIKILKDEQINFILTAKETSHSVLFDEVKELDISGKVIHVELKEDKVKHIFRFVNNVSLNQEHKDLKVNFLECFEETKDGNKRHFSWVTDIEITEENVLEIMRAGRARWKIENETFNTLKNQGYNFEHNFGHGEKNLSVNMAYLMMIAFFIDQVQQACCKLFQMALQKMGSKKYLWEKIRGIFHHYLITSWKEILELVYYGFKALKPLALCNSC